MSCQLPAIRVTQAQEFLQSAALSMLSIAQSTVICAGLSAGLAVCVRGVAQGTLTVGDTVRRQPVARRKKAYEQEHRPQWSRLGAEACSAVVPTGLLVSAGAPYHVFWL